MKKRCLAFLLAVSMIMSIVPFSAFALDGEGSEDPIDYVSLGASNTNGYGIRGYLPEEVTEDPLAANKANLNDYGYDRKPEDAYPAMVKEALEEANPNKTVTLHQLAISSMRTEEVRYLLDDKVEPDAYMEWRFTGGQKWFDRAVEGGEQALREAYAAALAEAELVTIDLGWNNFGVFAFNNIKTILADGNYWKEPDFSWFLNETEEGKIEDIRKMVLDILVANGGMNIPGDKLDKTADVLLNATLAACFNFDVIMEKIYVLNPDVKVVVINIQNLADGLVVDFGGKELKLGDIYAKLIDVVNIYRATESPYADRYYFADTGDVTTFLDELVAWEGEPLGDNMKDCFDMYDDNLYVRSIVEYMMVGQALSGLFQGFRDTCLEAGLGSEETGDYIGPFGDDEEYTYEFALTREPEELLSLNLGALDLSNPAGDDKDVEEYGKALSKHLQNLRGDAPNVAAYDYVFENLLADLNARKADLETEQKRVADRMDQLGESASNEELLELQTTAAAVAAGLEQLNQAIDVIVPGAKAEFATKLEGVYTTYHNTLNYAYDVVATIVQYVLKLEEITVNADSLNGFNTAAGVLMGYIADSFLKGAQQKFQYELQANGLANPDGTQEPEFVLNEELFKDPNIVAIAVLAGRYELGNSFFAHPNVQGHEEITAAIMNALKDGTSGDQFTEENIDDYIISGIPNVAPVLRDIAAFLRENKYISVEQVLDILNGILPLVGEDMKDDDVFKMGQIIYETLMYGDLDVADKVEVIKGVYVILKNAGYMPGEYVKYLKILEELCAHEAMKVVSDEQAFDIVDCIYKALTDDKGFDYRAVAREIYFNILKADYSEAMLLAGELPELNPTEKLAIVEAVYDVMKDNGVLNPADPDLVAFEDLYDKLKNDEVVSDELALSIFDTAIEAVLTNEILDEEVIGNVAEEIIEKVLGEGSPLDAEKKGQIFDLLKDALNASTIPVATVPGLDVLVALTDELKASGYLTDKQTGELIEALYPVLKTQTADTALVDEVYNIVFNQPDLSVMDKFMILMITYDVLEEYGYVDMAYTMGYEAAKTNGYVDQAAAAVKTAKVAVEAAKVIANGVTDPEIKAALLAELDATAQTLVKIEELLESDALATKDGAWAEIMALESELNNHADKLWALAYEVGVELDPYIQQVADAAVEYATLVAEIAEEAYNWTVDAAEAVVEGYAELVEEIGQIADELHPELGAAVRKYLTEVPADTLAILYAHGEEAVTVLMAKAALASGDVYAIAAALGQIVYENGDKIAEAIAADESGNIAAIRARLEQAAADLSDMYKKINSEIASTDYMEKMAELLVLSYELYKDLYAEIADIVGEVTGTAEYAAIVEALWPALMELVEVADYAGEYGEWIAGDMQLMMSELVWALFANNDEFMWVFMPLLAQNLEAVNEYLSALAKEYGELAWNFYLQIRDEVIPAIIETIKDYGEQAWDQIKKQLDTVCGMVDETVKAVKEIIAELQKKLEELKQEIRAELQSIVDGMEAMLDELKALLAQVDGLSDAVLKEIYAAIEKVEDALDALREIINGNFDSIKEMLKAVADAKEELLDALEALIDVLKNNADEIYAQMKDQLDEVYQQVLYVRDNLDEVLEELGQWLLAELVKALPEIDAALYDFFYNNPDKVIAFFEENGEFFAENYEYALAVLGYIAYTFGPDVLEWVMENPEEALEKFVAWYEKYGERTWAMILVYLEELGVIDAAKDLAAEIEDALEELYAQLEECHDEAYAQMLKQIEILRAELEALRAEVEAAANEQLMKLVAQIEKQLDTLEAMIRGEIEATIEEIKAQIAAVEKALDELVEAVIADIEAAAQAAILAAVEAIKAQLAYIEGAAEWLEDAIAEAYEAFIDALIAALPEIDAYLYDWFYNNPETVIAFFEENGEFFCENYEVILAVLGYIAYTFGPDVLEWVMENPEEALEQFVAWYEKYGDRVWAMIDVYLEALGIYDLIEGNVKLTQAKIEAAIAKVIAMVEGVQTEISEALLAQYEALLARVEELVEELKAQANAQMLKAIEKIEAKIAEIDAMIKGEIEATVAEIKEAIDELIAMVKAALYDATHGEYTVTTDSYYVAIGDDTVWAEESYADKLAAYLGIVAHKAEIEEAEKIAAADLITIGFDNNAVVDYMMEQVQAYVYDGILTEYVPSDWNALVGEELAVYVEQAKEELAAELAASIPAELDAGYLLVAVDAYAYGYVSQLIENIQMVETVKAINDEALIILVGQYNPMENFVLTLGETEFAMGEYLDYLVAAVNLESFAYALITGNAIYVDAPAVETEWECEEIETVLDVEDFLMMLIFNPDVLVDMLYPCDDGQEYIKEQILGALKITGKLGDANNDGKVNNIDAMLILQYYVGLIDETQLNIFVCDVDGNGVINNVDAMLVLQYYVGLITIFPVAQ